MCIRDRLNLHHLISFRGLTFFVSGACLGLAITWITRTGIQRFPAGAEGQFAVIVLLLAWSQFILQCDKLPVIGIFVVMFGKVLWTFIKVSFFGILLLFAFAVVLMAIFKEPHILVYLTLYVIALTCTKYITLLLLSLQRSPFANFGRSMLKTIAMTAGSIDFDSTFRLDLAGMREEEEDVRYLHLSGLLWIIFIIIMPILFANMLVSESDIWFRICMHVHAQLHVKLMLSQIYAVTVYTTIFFFRLA